MARFRLRFLLQEIDLGQGITKIGRGATCQVTIDDPLVSREHARLRVEGNRVTLEDLGSRNGVKVGGKPITGPTELADGDRFRIGSQELVLCVIGSTTAQTAQRRTTGFMCHCADCGIPYAAESPACPACGSTQRLQDDTLSGAKSERDWSLELAAEAVGRALEKRSWEDLERLLMRARLHVEQRLADGGPPIDRRPLHGLGDASVALAGVTGELAWLRWALALYETLGLPPELAFVQRLTAFPAEVKQTLAPALRRVVESVTAQGGPKPDDRASFQALLLLLPRT
ncbi:MAG TPA: FHA domain-containing protein [Polyangiaceae bacterium]